MADSLRNHTRFVLRGGGTLRKVGAPEPGAPCSWKIHGKKGALYTFLASKVGGHVVAQEALKNEKSAFAVLCCFILGAHH